jgi:hypothetical protein
MEIKAFANKILLSRLMEKTIPILLTPKSRQGRGHVPSPVNGTACIVDGRIKVSDPKYYGSYPTIVVPDDPCIRVTVDGKQVQGEVVVSESHNIQVELIEQKPSVTYELIVSDDELSVSVKAIVVPGIIPILKDCAPSQRLELRVEKTAYPPEEASPSTISELLSANGFKGTIDPQGLERICKAKETTQEVVLRGVIPRTDGSDKWKFLHFPTETDHILRTKRGGKVSIGTTLGLLKRGIGNIPGKNVYGKEIVAESNEPSLSFGDGVIHVNDHLVASRNGRIFITKDHIDVVPEITIEHDVSGKDGTIVFDGNVVVKGSVKNGASIKASGLVTIHGAVRESEVLGEQGVIVKGEVNRAKVIGGYQKMIYQTLSGLVKATLTELNRFRDEYLVMVEHALRRSNAHVIVPKIPRLLFDKRHAELLRLLSTFVTKYSDDLAHMDTSYRMLKDLIVSKWQSEQRHSMSQKDIDFMIRSMEEYRQKITSMNSRKSFIKVTACLSSTLQSTGNIIVRRRSVSSTMESGNTLSILGSMRGGFAISRKSAYFGQIGTPSATEGSVRVINPDGFIRGRLAYENTLLQVGDKRARLYHMMRDFRFGGE